MSKFQRRHYEAIAEVLAVFHSKGSFTVEDIDEEFIAMFQTDNPNFKRERFKKKIEDTRW
jgi:hypothetical protein